MEKEQALRDGYAKETRQRVAGGFVGGGFGKAVLADEVASNYVTGMSGGPVPTAARDVSGGELLMQELFKRRSHHQHELEKVDRAIEMAKANPVLLETVEFRALIDSLR